MQSEKKTVMMLKLAEIMGVDTLRDIRIGALLYHTRPELGRLFVEITAPRLTAPEDDLNQIFVEILEKMKEYTDKED